ncbi:MAG: BsuPI-related putative proteinase inhibitor [Halanaerobiales bacterium]
MKNNKVFYLSLVIFISVFSLTLSADEGELIGSQTIDLSDPVLRIDEDLVPLNDIASNINYSLEWELVEDEVQGSLGDLSFSTSDFIIYQNELYVNHDIFKPELGLEVEMRGNTYYFYRYKSEPEIEELKLDLQTSETTLERKEPLAVSLLLLNNIGKDIEFYFASSRKYDLVIKRYDREVWRLSEGKVYTQNIIQQELKEGEYLLFTELITPDLNPGRYNLTAEIETTDEIIQSDSVVIKIK